jgi:hypothetical protein
MKDFLQDLVAHTHTLGVLPLVKVAAEHDNYVEVDSMAEDRSVILNAKTFAPVNGLSSVFGMPNLNKLDLHLKCPEYKNDAVINIVYDTRDGEYVPTGLHFTNAAGDFQNDYRFMARAIIEAKVKKPKNKVEIVYDIEFKPEAANVQRLKFQAAAHTEETVFQVSTEDNNLVFSFGDASTHAGTFVFYTGIDYKLKNTWSWPVAQILSILNLDGTITMRIADQGALQIVVDSGIAEYTYTLPAQTK